MVEVSSIILFFVSNREPTEMNDRTLEIDAKGSIGSEIHAKARKPTQKGGLRSEIDTKGRKRTHWTDRKLGVPSYSTEFPK
jgi:hypothetical protein